MWKHIKIHMKLLSKNENIIMAAQKPEPIIALLSWYCWCESMYCDLATLWHNLLPGYSMSALCFIKLQRHLYIGQHAYVKTSLCFMKQSPGFHMCVILWISVYLASLSNQMPDGISNSFSLCNDTKQCKKHNLNSPWFWICHNWLMLLMCLMNNKKKTT